MNTLKLLFVALSATGFGFGINHFQTENVNETDQEYYGCHMDFDGDMLSYFFERFDEEDRVLIQEQLDALLLEYGITSEDFNNDVTLRHEIMSALHQFIEDQEIEYQYSHRPMHR